MDLLNCMGQEPAIRTRNCGITMFLLFALASVCFIIAKVDEGINAGYVPMTGWVTQHQFTEHSCSRDCHCTGKGDTRQCDTCWYKCYDGGILTQWQCYDHPNTQCQGYHTVISDRRWFRSVTDYLNRDMPVGRNISFYAAPHASANLNPDNSLLLTLYPTTSIYAVGAVLFVLGAPCCGFLFCGLVFEFVARHGLISLDDEHHFDESSTTSAFLNGKEYMEKERIPLLPRPMSPASSPHAYGSTL